MGMIFGGLFGVLFVIAEVCCILSISRSGASFGAKLMWILLVLALPVLGLMIWVIAGPKQAQVGLIPAQS